MPLTMPSTAWSRAASSNTMFAALPPSSRVRALSVPAIALWIRLPISVEPVNATLATSRWGDERHPDLAGARDDVDDARREVGLAADVREQEGAERRGRGGLEDDRVAGGEGRGDLPGQHEQREVPG